MLKFSYNWCASNSFGCVHRKLVKSKSIQFPVNVLIICQVTFFVHDLIVQLSLKKFFFGFNHFVERPIVLIQKKILHRDLKRCFYVLHFLIQTSQKILSSFTMIITVIINSASYKLSRKVSICFYVRTIIYRRHSTQMRTFS